MSSLALFTLLGACDPGDGVDTADTADTADTGSDDTGAPVATCEGDHFASSADLWTLPSYVEEFPSLGDTGYCDNGGRQVWTTTDLTGDGLADLVITRDCEHPATGASSWRVHPNTGAGFAAQATTWAIPSSPDGFDTLGDEETCDAGGWRAWGLADLTGDGRPDFVMTLDCQDAATGDTKWRVYENTGSGFSSQSSAWSVPAYSEGLDAVGGEEYCDGPGRQSWSLLDLTADGLPDLVFTDVCGDTATGDTSWRVHANTGSGFAATATTWALPAYPEDFALLAGEESCASGADQSWATTDLTGDGKPDLVVTRECTRDTTGEESWRVHANTGSGFAAEPTTWALPALPEPLFLVGGLEYCNSGRQQWSLLEMTGDGKPDLVLTEECAKDSTGTDEWRVHPNTGSGFGPARSWGLPSLPEPVRAAAETEYCDVGTQIWATTDLDGDALPDLVLTDTCGNLWSGWRVYPGACAD